MNMFLILIVSWQLISLENKAFYLLCVNDNYATNKAVNKLFVDIETNLLRLNAKSSIVHSLWCDYYRLKSIF